MRLPLVVLALVLIGKLACAEEADQPWQVRGEVVDEKGAPVEDFEVAPFWMSNGTWWDEKGELLKEAAAGKLWTNEGTLAADPKLFARKSGTGTFVLDVDGRTRVALFAVDSKHERGGIVVVEQSSASEPVQITLVPLVRVSAKPHCSEAGRTPEWSNAVIGVATGQGEQTNLMICGSFRGQISFLLPPGKYELSADSTSPRARLRVPKEGTDKGAATTLVDKMCFEVPQGTTTQDLGVIELMLPRDKDGIPRDITQHYGKAPPEIDITDARGAPKTVKLADFHGKWVVLDFWAVWCGPCVYRSLPELTKFYEEHAADRERFEILSICATEREKALTIDAYDVLANPLVEKAWGGKQLPFPVLIDGEGRTCGVYGIQMLPTVMLIDPEGRLVKDGDLKMLAEKLKEK